MGRTSRGHRTGRLTLAASLAGLVFAAAAVAGVGKLTPKGCIEDDDLATAVCDDNFTGLDGVRDVAVSPDGTSLYAVSPDNDNAIVRFKRNIDSGKLTAKDCVKDEFVGMDGCVKSSPGLEGARSVAVSPDGSSVYVASVEDNALLRLSRDLDSGKLSPKNCFVDADFGDDLNCEDEAPAIWFPNDVAVSPDGTTVYVTSLQDAAISIFERDPANGRLTYVGCVEDENPGYTACDTSSPGLNGATRIAISPDGTSVYVTGVYSDAVVHLRRNADGTLEAESCVDDPAGFDACGGTTAGLLDAHGVAVSPDGGSVYVTGANVVGAIVRFNRDPLTGGLTPKNCIQDEGGVVCGEYAEGLSFPRDVAVSADGESVYAVSNADDSIARFNRNTTSGGLTPKGCVDDTGAIGTDCDDSADGLTGSWGLALSLDDTSLYVGAQDDSAVTRFERDATP